MSIFEPITFEEIFEGFVDSIILDQDEDTFLANLAKDYGVTNNDAWQVMMSCANNIDEAMELELFHEYKGDEKIVSRWFTSYVEDTMGETYDKV